MDGRSRKSAERRRVATWCLAVLVTATATLAGRQVDEHRRRLMEAKSALDAANYGGNLERLNQIIGDFDRLSSQDRSDWIADYHAGYGHFVMALMVGPGGLLTREGDAGRSERHTAESIRHLERALTRAPDSAESLALLAHLYTMTLRAAPPDQREALRARSQTLLSSALTRSPRNPRAGVD